LTDWLIESNNYTLMDVEITHQI